MHTETQKRFHMKKKLRGQHFLWENRIKICGNVGESSLKSQRLFVAYLEKNYTFFPPQEVLKVKVLNGD